MSILSTSLLDAIIISILIEFLILAILCRKHNRRWLVMPLGLFLGSGAALMVALRVSIAGQDEFWVIVFMSAALVTHIACLITFSRELSDMRQRGPQSSATSRS